MNHFDLKFTVYLINVSGRVCKMEREDDGSNNCKVRLVKNYPQRCKCNDVMEYYSRQCKIIGEKGKPQNKAYSSSFHIVQLS